MELTRVCLGTATASSGASSLGQAQRRNARSAIRTRCSRLRGLVDQDGLQAKRAARAPTRFASRNLQVRSRSDANRGVIAADVAPTCDCSKTCLPSRLSRAARTIELIGSSSIHGGGFGMATKLVATAIVIPNFKHSWACLGGAKSRRPKRP